MLPDLDAIGGEVIVACGDGELAPIRRLVLLSDRLETDGPNWAVLCTRTQGCAGYEAQSPNEQRECPPRRCHLPILDDLAGAAVADSAIPWRRVRAPRPFVPLPV